MAVCMQNLKRNTPGLSFTDVGRALGERWKKMTGMCLLTCAFTLICTSGHRTVGLKHY